MKTSAPTALLTRSITGWGVSARIEASDEEILARVLQSLPKGFEASAGAGAGPCYLARAHGPLLELLKDDRRRFKGKSRRAFRSAVAEAFETLASVESTTFAFLHAGGVEIDGRAILFPGRSHAGKSTLTAAFLRRGAAFLSDDMLPVDSRLHAHPFPRPLGIRAADGGSPRRTSVRTLGARSADRAVPIALIWCGQYEPHVRRPSFRPRLGRDAFAELLAHCPGAQVRPEVIVPILTGLARGAPVFAGVRGDADAMVDAVLRRLT